MKSEQFDFNKIKDKVSEWIETDFIKPEDIPAIELYMDQITTFMDKQLKGTKRYPDDKILTKTMINNYSKNDLLPPSDKKKYSKDHMILLIYIYYMKYFLSINDIKRLIKPMTDNHFQSSQNTDHILSMSDIYEDIFKLEQQYKINLKDNVNEVCRIADREFPEDSDYLKTFAMIAMLSYDIYAKKQLIERLLDSIVPDSTSKDKDNKNAIKEAKEARKQMEKQAKARKKEKDKS